MPRVGDYPELLRLQLRSIIFSNITTYKVHGVHKYSELWLEMWDILGHFCPRDAKAGAGDFAR